MSKAVFEFEVEGFAYVIHRDDILKALSLSLERDLHERVVALLEAARSRYYRDSDHWPYRLEALLFQTFLDDFFDSLKLGKDSEPLRRFLTIHGQEFRRKNVEIYKCFFNRLMEHLRFEIDTAYAKRLLKDLVGQPCLIRSTDLIKGFSTEEGTINFTAFLEYGWREAFKRIMDGESMEAKQKLWMAMRAKFPVFPEAYPSSVEEQAIILGRFKTKRLLEMEWTRWNEVRLSELPQALIVDLWKIVFGYVEVRGWFVI